MVPDLDLEHLLPAEVTSLKAGVVCCWSKLDKVTWLQADIGAQSSGRAEASQAGNVFGRAGHDPTAANRPLQSQFVDWGDDVSAPHSQHFLLTCCLDC